MAKVSPTQRSLKHLRAAGYHVEIVERWNQWSRSRHDLFNMFDLLALHPDGTLVGVQVTSTDHVAERVAKLEANPLLAIWITKNTAVVHGWAKRGPRGKRKLWTLKEMHCGKEGRFERQVVPEDSAVHGGDDRCAGVDRPRRSRARVLRDPGVGQAGQPEEGR
jgi:hypothetical protein